MALTEWIGFDPATRTYPGGQVMSASAMFWYDETVWQSIMEPVVNDSTSGTVLEREVATIPFLSTFWVYLIEVTAEVQSTSKWALTKELTVSTVGVIAEMLQVIVWGPSPPVHVSAGVTPGLTAHGTMTCGPMPPAWAL